MNTSTRARRDVNICSEWQLNFQLLIQSCCMISEDYLISLMEYFWSLTVPVLSLENSGVSVSKWWRWIYMFVWTFPLMFSLFFIILFSSEKFPLRQSFLGQLCALCAVVSLNLLSWRWCYLGQQCYIGCLKTG